LIPVNRESLHRGSAPKNSGRVSTFEDLEVYRVAREFRKAMYRVAKRLPEIDKFALPSQVRRAALSLTNNIAEGHGRYHYLDQIKFTLHSRGPLEELMDDLNVCEDEQYLPVKEIVSLKEEGWRVRQLIDGYVRYLRQQSTANSGSSVREDSPIYDEDVDDSRFSI
jgi:four helix bundle protein